MKIKVKHVLLFIIVSIAIMSFTIYNIVINNDVYEEVDNRNIINNKLISLMIEETRGSGVYKVSKDNKWPSKKYIFNETLSNCKNGSTLTWNENDNSVTVNVNKTDKCDTPERRPEDWIMAGFWKADLHLDVSFFEISKEVNLLIRTASNQ